MKKKNFAFLIFVAIGFLIAIAINNQEKADCLQWRDWEKMYPLFEPSEEQIKICQRYDIKLKEEKEKKEKEDQEKSEKINATIYAYSSEPAQTDSRPFEMASGYEVYKGAIACPARLPFGTKVEIRGRLYTCEDRMAKRYRDGDNFDIWMQSKEEAIAWGVAKEEIKIYNK